VYDLLYRRERDEAAGRDTTEDEPRTVSEEEKRVEEWWSGWETMKMAISDSCG
jgi:hypothetical protein